MQIIGFATIIASEIISGLNVQPDRKGLYDFVSLNPMKQDKHTIEKDDPGGTPPVAKSMNIDFLVVLQAGAGLLCIILIIWMILHFILNVI